MKKILIVDDDTLLSQVLNEFLTGIGYECENVYDGESALQIFSPEKHSLIILDRVMPGIDGIEVMERVRDIYPDTKIIMMTGYPTVDSAYTALFDGITDYIIKPFRFNEIAVTIKKQLQE
ncbi:MAG: response regulator [Candidatus Cloacimonetes bacterium]|nr:response regulator [Candidatus Cloacimonadota bacterium]